MSSGVVIIDREGILRDGLCALLANESDLKVLASGSSVAEAAAKLGNSTPRLVIVEVCSRRGTGAETLLDIKRRWPGVRILVLTSHTEDRCFDEALGAGADGLLLKSDSGIQLREAIRSILAGNGYVSPAVQGQVIKHLVRATSQPAGAVRSSLTDREREVMRLIAAGRRTREIAVTLSLSHKTVEKHRTSLMRKLGLRSAPAVAAYAIANGFSELTE